MLLSLMGNNNIRGTQLGTPVNNSEFSNFKGNENVFEDLYNNLLDFIKIFEEEFFYQDQNIDDKELKKIYMARI